MNERHHRRSIRLSGYDYSSAGAYFVTVCARNRECLFGEIVDGKMRLNDTGQIVTDAWGALPDHFPGLRTDVFVVMPNHVHGIVVVVDAPVGAIHESPLPVDRRRMTIPLVVGRLKMVSAKQINAWRKTPGLPVWQRNYYEHVIRDEDSLDRIRLYIAENPARWNYDRENPAAAPRETKDKWAV